MLKVWYVNIIIIYKNVRFKLKHMCQNWFPQILKPPTANHVGVEFPQDKNEFQARPRKAQCSP